MPMSVPMRRAIAGTGVCILMLLYMPDSAVVIAIAGPCAAWYCWRHPPEGCCQSCGYDLTGLTSDECPECGARPEPGAQRHAAATLNRDVHPLPPAGPGS
ncbi:MAG: hypothetical protein KF745_00500 [Phycisphaeraceae bacterium]|nr:hypothetical protein [Phycisphaeraceae bacterium]